MENRLERTSEARNPARFRYSFRGWGGEGYADGSLGSETAYFFDAYTDAPNSHGLLSDEMHPAGEMLKRLRGADAAGLQLCIHAIGDRAIAMTAGHVANARCASAGRALPLYFSIWQTCPAYHGNARSP